MAITVRVSVCVFVWLCVCARACLLAHRCIRVLRRGLSAGWIGRPTLPAFVMHASRRFPFRLCRGEERHGGLPGVKRADLGDGGDRSDEDDTDTTLVDGVGAVDGLGEGGTQMHQGPAAADGEKGKETSEGQVKTYIQIYIYILSSCMLYPCLHLDTCASTCMHACMHRYRQAGRQAGRQAYHPKPQTSNRSCMYTG